MKDKKEKTNVLNNNATDVRFVIRSYPSRNNEMLLIRKGTNK